MNMAEPLPPPQHFSRISNPVPTLPTPPPPPPPPPPPYPQGAIILTPPLAAAGQIVWTITPAPLLPVAQILPLPPPPPPSGGFSGVAPCIYSYQCFTPTHQPLPPLTIHPISPPQRPQPLQVNGKQQTSGSFSDSSGSRGTGVFLPPPHSSTHHPPLPIQKSHTNHNNKLTRCKGIWKRVNKNDDEVVKQQMEGQQNTTIPSPPDLMGLPKEWTY